MRGNSINLTNKNKLCEVCSNVVLLDEMTYVGININYNLWVVYRREKYYDK